MFFFTSRQEALKRYRAHTASPMRSQSELAHFRFLALIAPKLTFKLEAKRFDCGNTLGNLES